MFNGVWRCGVFNFCWTFAGVVLALLTLEVNGLDVPNFPDLVVPGVLISALTELLDFEVDVSFLTILLSFCEKKQPTNSF